MIERKYTWYIEPLDSRTNETISQELPVQNFSRGIICENKQTHNLWGCSYIIMFAFVKSKLQLGLNFKL